MTAALDTTAPPLIRIEDIAHVRFAAPDLDRMRAFLVEFGLSPFDAPDGRLYARGAGPAPFVHVTETGPAGFRGLAFRAASRADLDRLAAAEGVAVEPFDAPGGGHVVRLKDPDGFAVEVVCGQAPGPVLPLPAEALRNSASARLRQREAIRLEPGASHVLRLGHCVLNVRDFPTSEAWYKSRFGFITSDEIEAGREMPLGAFMRCDRGDIPTDHHTLFLAQLPGAPRFNHAAFEVAGFDDLMLGHAHLKAHDRTPAWGVGRHVLGSQIFDYWKDPWGHELEHWTDGDLFTAADAPHRASVETLLAVQWGTPHPMFAKRLAPSAGAVSQAFSIMIRIKRLFSRKQKEMPA